MSYGYDERRQYQELKDRYDGKFPHSYGYGGGYPEDYERFLILRMKLDPPSDPTELKKNELTRLAIKAEKEKRYLNAEKLWSEIAVICHQQNKERDAYWVEHRAKQCRHMQIFKEARISIQAFSDIPNADKLQDALTDAAVKKLVKKDYEAYTVYSLLNARLCHAQGKEQDAFWLEEAVRPWGFFDTYFVKPGERPKNALIEEKSLQQIAMEYQSELYPE